MEWLKFLLLLFMLWRHFFCTFQDIKIYLLSQKSCVFCIVHHDTVTCLFTCQTLTVAEIQAYVKMVVLVSTLTLISSGVIANLALLVTSAKLVSTATKLRCKKHQSNNQWASQASNQWGYQVGDTCDLNTSCAMVLHEIPLVFKDHTMVVMCSV